MDILSMIAGQHQAQHVGQQIGAPASKTQDALAAAVPLLLGALTRNAQQGHAPAIERAITQHGTELDQFTGQGQLPDMDDGQKILGHIFGGQQQAAAGALAKKAGVDAGTAQQILSVAAPLVLAYLSRQRTGGAGRMGGMQNAGAAAGGSDITHLLTGVLGSLVGSGLGSAAGGLGGGLGSGMSGSAQGDTGAGGTDLGGVLGTLNRALDRDGDGNALNDLMGMLGGKR